MEKLIEILKEFDIDKIGALIGVTMVWKALIIVCL